MVRCFYFHLLAKMAAVTMYPTGTSCTLPKVLIEVQTDGVVACQVFGGPFADSGVVCVGCADAADHADGLPGMLAWINVAMLIGRTGSMVAGPPRGRAAFVKSTMQASRHGHNQFVPGRQSV